jgi:hypothetical protein
MTGYVGIEPVTIDIRRDGRQWLMNGVEVPEVAGTPIIRRNAGHHMLGRAASVRIVWELVTSRCRDAASLELFENGANQLDLISGRPTATNKGDDPG